MNTRPLRGWLVLFVLMMASLSVGLLASRKHWPPGLSPWRDWLSAQAAQPPGDSNQAPGSASRQLAAAGFEFPPDEAGKLLEEKLTPPRKLPMPAYPFVDKPRPARVPAAEELGRHVKLPPAEPSSGSSLLPDERRPHARTTAAIDSPPLAFEADPRRPARPTWPHPQLAYVQGPNPQRVPPLAALGRPHVERPTLQDDPTAVAARRSLLVPASLSPPVLPPPLRLTIPDPDEYRRIVHFANPPADHDLAVQHFQRPETPVLPVVEAKKK
jgi:hypothetical protein